MIHKKKIIFIAWNKYHTRNKSISNLLGIQNFHIGKNEKSFFHSAISFIPKSVITLKILFKEKPDIVIVTNTIWVLPALIILFCKFFNKKIVLDTHSSGMDNIWFAYPLFLRKYFVNLADLSLVTNKNHAVMVRNWGGKAMIFPDPPIDFSIENRKFGHKKKGKIKLCYINTYASDEPYNEVVNAVENLKNIELYITGNYIGKNINKNAKNVIHTGFLPLEQYYDLLVTSDLIIVLTYRENTFQCGGNEALSLEKPLILSNTKFLMSYFGNAAVFVDPKNSQSIVAGIKTIIANYALYQNRIKILHKKVKTTSKKNVEEFYRLLY